jgi:hypothetical protein
MTTAALKKWTESPWATRDLAVKGREEKYIMAGHVAAAKNKWRDAVVAWRSAFEAAQVGCFGGTRGGVAGVAGCCCVPCGGSWGLTRSPAVPRLLIVEDMRVGGCGRVWEGVRLCWTARSWFALCTHAHPPPHLPPHSPR